MLGFRFLASAQQKLRYVLISSSACHVKDYRDLCQMFAPIIFWKIHTVSDGDLLISKSSTSIILDVSYNCVTDDYVSKLSFLHEIIITPSSATMPVFSSRQERTRTSSFGE